MRQKERQRKTRRSSDRDAKPQTKLIISDGLLLKVSGLTSTTETWSYWSESRKGQARWLKDWSIWHMKRGLELGLFNLGKWSLLGDLINVYRYLMEAGEKMAQRYPVAGKEAMGIKPNTQKIHLNIRRTFFYGESGQTLDQVAQRGCGDPENPTGHGLEQPALADLVLSRGLD